MRRDLKAAEDRAADVEVLESGAVFRQEERADIEISGDVARGVIVGEADEVAVVAADGVLNAIVGEIPVGEESCLPGEPVIQGEETALGGDEILFEVVVPIETVRSEHPPELDLKAFVEVDVQVTVEQVPRAVDASLERDFVFEEVG